MARGIEKYQPTFKLRLNHRPLPRYEAAVVFAKECEEGDPAQAPERMIIKSKANMSILGKLYDWVILQQREKATVRFLDTHDSQMNYLRDRGLVAKIAGSNMYWKITGMGARVYEFNYWYEQYQKERRAFNAAQRRNQQRRVVGQIGWVNPKPQTEPWNTAQGDSREEFQSSLTRPIERVLLPSDIYKRKRRT